MLNDKELKWLDMTKEELIKELDKADREIRGLNKIIDGWEEVYKPRKDTKDLEDYNPFRISPYVCDYHTYTYIDDKHFYERMENYD